MKKRLLILVLFILPLGVSAKPDGYKDEGHCQVAILPGCQKCE